MNKLTYAYAQGIYMEDCLVEFDYSPAEPEVNHGAECEVTAVHSRMFGDVLFLLSKDELAELAERMLIETCDQIACDYEMKNERRWA